MANKTGQVTGVSSASVLTRKKYTASREELIKDGIVKALLTQEVDIHAKKGMEKGEVNVHVKGNTLTLSGTVESWITKGSISSIVSQWKNKGNNLKQFGKLEIKNEINIENQNGSLEEGYTPLFSDFDDVKNLERIENGDPEPKFSEMI